ncbi:ras association domain-containing protein 7-like isoform X2 [Sphaeramia orbicularis]|uniref:ras association domain-containing protein 7-like isoform X2 n=1 Tax=Sphaeramia orbicularis TaxID=375764 RepID=UPI00117F561E|nr:ras association domain-containing protein 7-like isoform X2 [Sphaeramia orbicularis]
MELKVWVEGVVRVVCGLSLNTSCQDVVIALAQAIGQTGRYVLILKLRGKERQLLKTDCPLQELAQLGQQAAEVHFVLRRTGPSLSEGSTTDTRAPLTPFIRHPEPKLFSHREPHKSFTFNLGPSTFPRRTKPDRKWAPSPEQRASPVPSVIQPSREELILQLLRHQRRLEHLEEQLYTLERETEEWEQRRRWSAAGPGSDVSLDQQRELELLEQTLRQNQDELRQEEYWEEQLEQETLRGQDMCRRLEQIKWSVDDQSYRVEELQARSERLQQDVRQRSEETLRPLEGELQQRLQQGDRLNATAVEMQMEMQAADGRVKAAVSSPSDLNGLLSVSDVYLRNAGIVE